MAAERVRVARHDDGLYLGIAGSHLNAGGDVALEAAGEYIPSAVRVAAMLAEEYGVGVIQQMTTSGTGRRVRVAVHLAPAPNADHTRVLAAVHALNGDRWAALDKLNKKCREGVDKHGTFLVDARNGLILKPAVGRRLASEKIAYGRLSAHAAAARYISTYYGTKLMQDTWHLVLEDASHGLTPPLAMVDIKIGRKTYDEDATEDKKRKELAKMVEGRTSGDGFRLVGLRSQVCASHVHHYDLRNANGQTREEFLAAFVAYFRSHEDVSRPHDVGAVRDLLAELRRLERVVLGGFGGVLRASSLFAVREQRPQGRQRLKIIDLGHFTETPNADDIDDNYLEGIRGLTAALEGLL